MGRAGSAAQGSGGVAVRVDDVRVTADGVLRLGGRAVAGPDAPRTGVLRVSAGVPGRGRTTTGRYRLDHDGCLVASVPSPATSRWSWLRWSTPTPGVRLRFVPRVRAASPAGEVRVLIRGLTVGRTRSRGVDRAHLVRVDPATDGTLRILLGSSGPPLEWAALRRRGGEGEVVARVEPAGSGDRLAVFEEEAFATTERKRHDLVAGWGSTEAEFDPPPGTGGSRAFPFRAVVLADHQPFRFRVHRAEGGHVSLDVVPAGVAAR